MVFAALADEFGERDVAPSEGVDLATGNAATLWPARLRTVDFTMPRFSRIWAAASSGRPASRIR